MIEIFKERKNFLHYVEREGEGSTILGNFFKK